MDLSAVLSDAPLPERTVEPEPEVEPEAPESEPQAEPEAQPEDLPEAAEAKAERERDEKGRFKPAVPQEALHAERIKRRELEQELQKLKEAKPKTDFYQDADKAFEERISEAMRPWQERFFKLSVKAAKAGREDYDEVVSAFAEAAEKDPQLWDAFRGSDDPGEYAYSTGKYLRELSEVNGDIVAYGEKKRAEGAAEAEALKQRLAAMEAEIASLKGAKDKRDKIPQSLNGEQSVAARGDAFAGPTPLGNIINS